MIGYALAFGFAAISVALLLNLWRLATGPTVIDRLLAADTIVTNLIALIILYGIHQATSTYFEAALLFAMFGVISTIAYCRFMLRGDILE